MTLERFIARIIPIDVKPDGEWTRGRLIGVCGGNRRFDLRSVKRSFQSGARGFLFGPIYAKPWRLRTNVSCGGRLRNPAHVQSRQRGADEHAEDEDLSQRSDGQRQRVAQSPQIKSSAARGVIKNRKTRASSH